MSFPEISEFPPPLGCYSCPFIFEQCSKSLSVSESAEGGQKLKTPAFRPVASRGMEKESRGLTLRKKEVGQYGPPTGGSMLPDEGVSGTGCLRLRVSASELGLPCAVSILSALRRTPAKTAAGSRLRHQSDCSESITQPWQRPST